jgi:hypothetical protein
MGGALGLRFSQFFFQCCFLESSFCSWSAHCTQLKTVKIFKIGCLGLTSYVPWKCTTVILVNWAEKGRSMTDRKFRVQSSLFLSLWTAQCYLNKMEIQHKIKCQRRRRNGPFLKEEHERERHEERF